MVSLRAASAPASAVPSRGGEGAVLERERDRAVRRFDADWPAAGSGPSSDGEVASRVDEAGSRDAEERTGPIDRVALADSSEIEADTLVELDRARGLVDRDVSQAERRFLGTGRTFRTRSSKERSYPAATTAS